MAWWDRCASGRWPKSTSATPGSTLSLGVLDRQHAIPRGDAPGPHNPAFLGDQHISVQRHRGAHVPRQGIHDIPRLVAFGLVGFDDEMLFALPDNLMGREIKQVHPSGQWWV